MALRVRHPVSRKLKSIIGGGETGARSRALRTKHPIGQVIPLSFGFDATSIRPRRVFGEGVFFRVTKRESGVNIGLMQVFATGKGLAVIAQESGLLGVEFGPGRRRFKDSGKAIDFGVRLLISQANKKGKLKESTEK